MFYLFWNCWSRFHAIILRENWILLGLLCYSVFVPLGTKPTCLISKNVNLFSTFPHTRVIRKPSSYLLKLWKKKKGKTFPFIVSNVPHTYADHILNIFKHLYFLHCKIFKFLYFLHCKFFKFLYCLHSKFFKFLYFSLFFGFHLILGGFFFKKLRF